MALTIELLYFDGCPSHEAFLPRLHELLAQAGVDAPVKQRRVESDAAAQRERFLGPPTLRVDGVDIDPGAGDQTDYGFKCRLYPTDDGLRGAPPDEWVLDALQRAGHPISSPDAGDGEQLSFPNPTRTGSPSWSAVRGSAGAMSACCSTRR